MSKWFDVFKTGTHTDTAGRTHDITAVDLQTIERKFSEMNDDAALCVGHPKDNSPAYGWLKKVKVFGNKLKGLAADIVPEFAEAVNKRMYKKISVSLRPDLSIRHVGFLGAAPPAVKGLNTVPLNFTEEPGDFTIEFSEGELDFSDGDFAQGKIRTFGRIMQNLRDLVVEKFGIEPADKALPQWDLDYLKEEPPAPAETDVKSFNEPIITPEKGVKEDKPMKEKEKPETSGTEKTEDFAEKVTTLTGENDRLRQENEALKKGKIKDEVGNFVEKVKTAGRLLPKFERGITEILVDLKEAGQEINFSETEKKPAYDLLMEFVESVPVQIPTKEIGAGTDGEADGDSAEYSEGNVDPERLELHKKARALQKKENISYPDALGRITKGGK